MVSFECRRVDEEWRRKTFVKSRQQIYQIVACGRSIRRIE